MRSFCLTVLAICVLACPISVRPVWAQDEVPPGTEEEPAAAAESAEGEGEGEPEALEPERPPIYEEQLLRLSEILGALTFLRGLCGETDAAAWQGDMRTLLAAENPNDTRRVRLVARYNHGFETFNAVYRSCTPSARRAVERYLAEGQSLSADVRSRFGQ